MDRLFAWLKTQSCHMHCFIFDIMMSLAYIESTTNIMDAIETCPHAPSPYNASIGFVNLCACCYSQSPTLWKFQKAAKPSSGILGKISSEMTLKFIASLNDSIHSAKVMGGTGIVDAALLTHQGDVILAEIKSAPLMTYPVLFQLPSGTFKGVYHDKPEISNSQLQNSETALFLHTGDIIPLGQQGSKLWPFAQAIEFLCDSSHLATTERAMNQWLEARQAYIAKDREKLSYFLTNACGRPPATALAQGWPKKEAISDGKTSAGLDRTDDIKKGIYQTFKIATEYAASPGVKTALLSNLPPYRHYKEYVSSFVNIFWGNEQDLSPAGLPKEKLHRVFDYIITLDTENSLFQRRL